MILAQAKTNVMILAPRVKMMQECVALLEESLENDHNARSGLLATLALVQLIQLRAALGEGERDLTRSQQVIAQIESPVKIFRPAGYPPPQGSGAA
jgi:hypothetical protein